MELHSSTTRQTTHAPTANHRHFSAPSELSLYSVLMDLFTAATGTNSVTLEWAMLLLLLYPETGRRARQEMEAVVGLGRMVTLEDRPNLPYTQALMAEVLRRSSTLALAVPHRAEADMEISGMRPGVEVRGVLGGVVDCMDKLLRLTHTTVRL